MAVICVCQLRLPASSYDNNRLHSSCHSLMLLSKLPEASTVGETSASAKTRSECPVRVARQVCVRRSHSLMLLSEDAEASNAR
jgi:hypothetical protein